FLPVKTEFNFFTQNDTGHPFYFDICDMSAKSRNVLKTFSVKRILIPVIIGLAGSTYLLVSNFKASAFEDIHWSGETAFWLFIALLMVVTRELGYMYRIRVMTDNFLSWRKSFDVIMLWEFASAITPSVVGG